MQQSLWRGSEQYKGLHSISQNKLAIPKEYGGWRLKEGEIFGKSLASHSIWFCIQSPRLWSDILINKYIFPRTLID